MAKGHSYGPRRTPLPGIRKGSHLRVVPDRFRREDERAAIDEPATVHVMGALHPPCVSAVEEDTPELACGRCALQMGLDTANGRYAEFWMDRDD